MFNQDGWMLRTRQRVFGKRHRGFTMVELLIALAILAILFAAAMPSWAHYFSTSALRERAGALADSFLIARTEAIRRGGRVAVCPGSKDLCDPQAPGWEAGWLVFADDNRNGVRDPGEGVILREGFAPPGLSIRGNRPVSEYVSFTALGQLRRNDGALQMGTFTVCRSGFEGSKVVLANGGRVRITPLGGTCP